MKILVVFTGGTIGSSIKNGIADVDDNSAKDLLGVYPEIDFDCKEPFSILSENSTIDTLELICNYMLSLNYNNYDGVIITHGSDTLAYTAAALGYALSWVNIPVMITAADYVLSCEYSNGRDNFCGCVDFIREFSSGIHSRFGVFAVWKNHSESLTVHHALCLEQADFNDNFYSFQNKFYGTMENGSFKKNIAAPDKIEYGIFPKILQKNNISLSRNVFKFSSYVGADFERIIINDLDAVLIETYHSGTLCAVGNNTSFAKFVRKCKNNGTDVYVFSLKQRDYLYKSTGEIPWDFVTPLFEIGECAAFVGLLFRYGEIA